MSGKILFSISNGFRTIENTHSFDAKNAFVFKESIPSSLLLLTDEIVITASDIIIHPFTDVIQKLTDLILKQWNKQAIADFATNDLGFEVILDQDDQWRDKDGDLITGDLDDLFKTLFTENTTDQQITDLCDQWLPDKYYSIQNEQFFSIPKL
jgi:hypothetical protein